MHPRPHPWNESFAWQRPERDDYLLVTAEQADAFHERGFALIEDVLDAATIDEVTTTLDERAGATEAFLRQMPDERLSIAEVGAIVFSPHVVLSSDAARRFSANPVFAGLCHDLVGDDVRLYWDQLVYKHPEKPRQFPWHQDNGYTYVEPQQYLTCWVPLVDATIEHGCPWVVPGLHLGGTLAHTYVDPLGYQCLEDPEGAVAVPAAAGSIVVFSSLTPHMTGPNTTDEVRKAYILQYAPDGAERLDGNPSKGGPAGRSRQNNPDRQFHVVVDGEPVPA
jgi:ectoine hydroxylase-related dioxygenase (phytanoyl-CoA dioxygenase family)